MKKIRQQRVDALHHFDTFSPYFFLPFVLVLYFLTSLFDFHRFELFHLEKSIWPAVIVALLSYYVGVYIADRRRWTFPTFGLAVFSGYTRPVIQGLAIIGFIAYMTMVTGNFDSLFTDAFRYNLDPKLDFLSQLLWFAVFFLIAMKMIRSETVTKRNLLLYSSVYGMLMLLFLAAGYQTPIVVMLFASCIVFHYVVRPVKLPVFVVGLFVLVLFLSIFGFFRLMTEDQTTELNNREQPNVQLTTEKAQQLRLAEEQVAATPTWLRALNDESVTGHIVLSKIIEYTETESYLYGELHAGIFETVLPGEQIAPRMRVTEIVNSLSVKEGKYITRPSRTTTPTYIGQLFLDGGYVLVVIGFLLYGIIASMLYNEVKQAGFRSYQAIAYAFVMAVFTVSIHTGFLDLIFLLMISFVIVTAALDGAQEKVKIDSPNISVL